MVVFSAVRSSILLGVDGVEQVRTDYSLYNLTHSAKGNTVTIERTYAMAGIAFHQEEYAALRKFFGAVNAGDNQPLVLTSAKSAGN